MSLKIILKRSSIYSVVVSPDRVARFATDWINEGVERQIQSESGVENAAIIKVVVSCFMRKARSRIDTCLIQSPMIWSLGKPSAQIKLCFGASIKIALGQVTAKTH